MAFKIHIIALHASLFATACAASAESLQHRPEIDPALMPVERISPPYTPGTGSAAMTIRPPAPATETSEEVAQKEKYEAQKLAELAELSTQILDLRIRSQELVEYERADMLDTLRTAAGNRVVAMTKLEQLLKSPVETWVVFRPAVEQAFDELKTSIRQVEGALAH